MKCKKCNGKPLFLRYDSEISEGPDGQPCLIDNPIWKCWYCGTTGSWYDDTLWEGRWNEEIVNTDDLRIRLERAEEALNRIRKAIGKDRMLCPLCVQMKKEILMALDGKEG